MLKEIEKVYKLTPLSNYSLRHRLMIRCVDLMIFAVIRIVGKTMRYEVEGWENFKDIELSGKLPIYAFWHDRIFAGTYFFRDRGIVVMSSQSLDGEYIARFIKRLGYGTVRGSSTRGGVGALVEMIRLMRIGVPMAFAIDGPKGPRYTAKTGAVLLAKKTGNPIMPFVVEARNYWTVKSWDYLQVPVPFTKTKVIIATPIYVPPDADDIVIEVKLAELQRSLDELVVIGETWRISTKF